MSEDRPRGGAEGQETVSLDRPTTKSAAHRFGFVPCPHCNPSGLPSGEVHGDCPWCWDEGDRLCRRFVLTQKARQWAEAHGIDEDDIPTSPESRDALLRPPTLEIADTEPPPPPIKLDEDED